MPLPCSLCLPATTLPASIPTIPDGWRSIPLYPSGHRSDGELWHVGEIRRDAAPEPIPGIPHHETIEALRNSARTCPLCELIAQDVEPLAAYFQTIRDDSENRLMKQGYLFPSEFNLRLVRRMDGGAGFVVCVEDGGHDDLLYIASIIGFCRKVGQSRLQGVPGVEVVQDAGSESALEVVRQWVRDCRENHTYCHASRGFLPTRVLDLEAFSDTSRIRLEDTRTQAEIRGEYAALSHCWGGDQASHARTTTENIKKKLQSINVDDLPRTFRDAITVTHALGIRYLWIDSLCICQDDEKEWARESFAMSKVYSQAHLTIAADGSRGPANGLFQRKERSHLPVTVTVSSFGTNTHAPEKQTVPIVAFRLPIKSVAGIREWYELRDQPLSERAWAFQERRLPHRIIHFTDKQMLYECNTHFISEDGFCQSGRWHSQYPGPEPEYAYSLNNLKGPAPHLAWNDLLSNYSERMLTFNSDRLPAISGLARLIYEIMWSQGNPDIIYLAGLWSDFLIESLAWRGVHKDCFSTPPDRPLPGHDNYVAPSWSWASFPGRIVPDKIRGGHQNIAVVTRYNLVLKDKENPYGEVVEGWVQLRGPLFKIHHSEIPEPNPLELPMHLMENIRFSIPGTNAYGFYSNLDGVEGQSRELDDWVHGRDFYILILSRIVVPEGFYDSDPAAYTCLMLEAHTPDREETCVRQFQRVGIATVPATLFSEKYGNLEKFNDFTEVLLL